MSNGHESYRSDRETLPDLPVGIVLSSPLDLSLAERDSSERHPGETASIEVGVAAVHFEGQRPASTARSTYLASSNGADSTIFRSSSTLCASVNRPLAIS